MSQFIVKINFKYKNKQLYSKYYGIPSDLDRSKILFFLSVYKTWIILRQTGIDINLKVQSSLILCEDFLIY